MSRLASKTVSPSTLLVLVAAGFFVAAARVVNLPLAVLLVATVLWAGFVWLPAGPVSRVGARAAALLAPGLAWLLERIHPTIDWLVAAIHKRRPVRIHTGLYAKQDLVDLLQRQQVQADNRIEASELQIAEHALQFGDLMVSDVMIPRRAVDAINADDPVGPILMAELHRSGHSRFPVYQGSKDTIVGILYLREATTTVKSVTVSHLMHADHVCYIHEDQPLTEALQAIIKTKRQLLIAVNSFEEYVGVITFEDIVEQIIGQPVIDEFDRYDDLRAVAAGQAKAEHENNIEQATEVVQ